MKQLLQEALSDGQSLHTFQSEGTLIEREQWPSVRRCPIQSPLWPHLDQAALRQGHIENLSPQLAT